MREIIFRGKRADSGEWVEGDYYHEQVGGYLTAAFIKEPLTTGVWENHRVDPATVGQYTGLTDKNGKKIFEGDIVCVNDRLMPHSEKLSTFIGAVDHKDASFVIVEDVFTHYRWIDYEVEVIGNITDNPELLKGDNDAEIH